MIARPSRWVFVGAAAISLATSCAVAQLPGVPPADDPVYDRIVEDFIQWDIGNVRDPFAADRIKRRFAALKADEAMPALVRGLNKSTRMRASCPITAIAGKIQSILAASKDPEVGTHVLQHLDRIHAGQYRNYVNAVYSSAEQQMTRTMGKDLAEREFARRTRETEQRMVFSPGMKLTDLPPRDRAADFEEADTAAANVGKNAKKSTTQSTRKPRPTPNALAWTKLPLDKLVEHLADPAGRTKAISELYRRAAAGGADAVAQYAEHLVPCLSEADEAGRELAARLLGLVRCEAAVPHLVDALDDSSPKVRSAAATALARITRQLFGPSDNASESERHSAIERWREWLAQQSKPPR